MTWIVIGAIFIAIPFWQIYRRFGSFTNESFERWIFSMSFTDLIKVQVAVKFGFLAFLYGWMTCLVRGRG